MEAKVSVRIGSHVMNFRDDNINVPASGSMNMDNVKAEEVLRVTRYAESFKDWEDYFASTGVYMNTEEGRTMLVESENGTYILFKDEPGRKLVTEKLNPDVVEEILAITDYDNGNAVRKILEAHGYEKAQIEEIFASKADGRSFESPADNVDGRDVTDNSEIGAARLARDEMEDPNRGIFNEQEQIKAMAKMSPMELDEALAQFDEETRKELRRQIREEQDRNYDKEYGNRGNDGIEVERI